MSELTPESDSTGSEKKNTVIQHVLN
jgi:hypothetical protein